MIFSTFEESANNYEFLVVSNTLFPFLPLYIHLTIPKIYSLLISNIGDLCGCRPSLTCRSQRAVDTRSQRKTLCIYPILYFTRGDFRVPVLEIRVLGRSSPRQTLPYLSFVCSRFTEVQVRNSTTVS